MYSNNSNSFYNADSKAAGYSTSNNSSQGRDANFGYPMADAKVSNNTNTGMMGNNTNNNNRIPQQQSTGAGALDEDEEDNDDEDNVYDEDQLRFYQDVVDGRRRLDGDDPYWEMKAELSGSLSKLFGKQQKYDGSESYWERPQSYGLGNSAPIVPTQFNTYTGKTRAEDRAEAKDSRTNISEDKPAKTLYQMIQQGGITYDDMVKNRQIRSVVDRSILRKETAIAANDSTSNNATSYMSSNTTNMNNNTQKQQMYQTEREEGEEEEEDDDDDDDDEGGLDYEDENEDTALDSMLNSAGMSPNLLALLGMKVEKVEVPTDWKPPDRAGLDNSDPLVARK